MSMRNSAENPVKLIFAGHGLKLEDSFTVLSVQRRDPDGFSGTEILPYRHFQRFRVTGDMEVYGGGLCLGYRIRVPLS